MSAPNKSKYLVRILLILFCGSATSGRCQVSLLNLEPALGNTIGVVRLSDPTYSGVDPGLLTIRPQDPRRAGGPPYNYDGTRWLQWYDDRNDPAQAEVAFRGVETQYIAEPQRPENERRLTRDLAAMRAEFNRRLADLPYHPPQAGRVVRLLIEVVQWRLRGANRTYAEWAWSFYRLCDALGYRERNEVRCHIWDVPRGSGLTFNRIMIGGGMYVVDSSSEIHYLMSE